MKQYAVICQKWASQYLDLLRPFLDDVLILPDSSVLQFPLASHADLQLICTSPGHVILRNVLRSRTDNVNFLTNRGIQYSYTLLNEGPEYPADAGLCGLVLGDTLVHNPRITDPALAACFEHTIAVRQGYAACTALAVTPHAVITADPGIAAALRTGWVSDAEYGTGPVEVLQIVPGGIELPGYQTGFIGGASFSLRERILFCGDLNSHPQHKEIFAFIRAHGKQPVSLTDGPLTDIGAAVLTI